ncbi:MAG: hypothetical protein M1829_003869 [Trizodia sp. TS-e1964]|nr:MAG: hypothetical protein M1829_003869 [Trizodia sp. TS-e1964]
MSDTNQPFTLPYSCQTQQGSNHATWPLEQDSNLPPSIVVGYRAVIPRWDVSQAKIKLLYFVDTSSFPNNDDAEYAAEALQQAADEWNSLQLGLSIVRTSSRASAHFELIYDPNTIACFYADSPFPGEYDKPMIVTAFALSAPERGILKNVFLHELGHVLGLRHEFALDTTQQQQLNVSEKAEGAVQFKLRNPISVMSYAPKPKMQQTDIDGTKDFYNLKKGSTIDGIPIVDVLPKTLQYP